MKTIIQKIALAAAIASMIPAGFAAETGTEYQTGRQGAQLKSTEKVGTEHKYSGRITSIDRQAKTITVEDRKFGRETLHIGPDTRIMKGKESASWDQLKDGEEIHATATKSGDMSHALSVEIGK